MGRYHTKKPDKLTLFISLIILISTNMLKAQDNTDLFQSVFGSAPAPAREFPVPLYINKQYTDEINLYYDAQTGIIEIEALKLLDLLSITLTEETHESLKRKINSEKETLNPEVLNSAGLKTVYNSRDLSLFIEIPSSMQRENSIDLMDSGSEISGTPITPSPFSAYLNFFSSFNMNISGSPEQRETSIPLSLNLDTAFNIRSFVIEGDILLSYKENISLSDWNARFVKDIQNRDLRIKWGTITYPVSRLQGYYPLTGMVIGKNFTLNPYRNIQSLGSRSIVLDSPSDVEILVNGRLLKKIRLPAGKYNLENLQLDSGANKVEIIVKEITGKENSILFSQPFDISLLKKGIFDFSSAFGIYEFEMDTPVYSGYFRYGLSDSFTVGGNLQSDFQMFNGGLSLLLGTRAGNFSLESSISHDDGFDWAAILFYRYTNNRFPFKNNWSLSVAYRGENYSGLRLEKTSNSVPLRLGLYYGQILPGDIHMGLTVNREFKSGWNGGNTEIGVNLSRNFKQGFSVNLNLNEKIEDSGIRDFSAGLTVTFNLKDRNETVATTASWPGTAIEQTWQKSSESRLRGYSLNGGISGLPSAAENTPFGISLGGEYRGYKFTGSVSHNSSFLNTGSLSLHSSSINLSTALVYADSVIALTRPVYDSFVIVKPRDSFSGYKIGINPEGKSYGSMLDGKGSAVLPGFHSYRNGRIILEAIDLPIGFDLGDSVFTFQPVYKSGTVITIGSEAVIFAGGILTGISGEPAALSAIVVRPATGGENKLFFTNREGYFEFYGLYPGEWIIELMGNNNQRATISIPEGITGFYELQDVQLKRGEI